MESGTARPTHRGTDQHSLTHRLFVALLAVLGSMAGTMVLAAAIIGPPVFDQHMREAEAPGQSTHGAGQAMADHAGEAFQAAGLASITAGLLIGTLVALVVGTVLTRRIGRGLDALAVGAAAVAVGDYGHPVDLPPSVRELDDVARAFNDMAARIGATEDTRRRMLTDLAHEMRTPLAAAEVTLEAVEDGVRPLDAETIDILRSQTRRLMRLTEDIRDVSAAEEGRIDLHLRTLDLDALVGATLAAADAAMTAAGVTVTLRAESRAAVRVDENRLGQTLDNLLRNARQHTRGASGHVLVATARRGRTVEITVTDDGTGIAAHDAPHIFERFYRADTRRRDGSTGTGVGLAISRAIARAHGGDLVLLTTTPGEGTTFLLTLPVAPTP